MVKKNVLGGLVFGLLVISLITVSCATTGSGNNAERKTLFVQGIPFDVYRLIDNNSFIFLYPSGEENKGIAGAHLQNDDIVLNGAGPFDLSIPLYKWGNPTRWSGSGTYDIIIRLRGDAFLYKAVSVDFSSADTTVNFSDFTKITGIGNMAERKTLFVQGIPFDVYSLIDNDSFIFLYPSGEENEGIAGAHLQNDDIVLSGAGPFDLSIPLYKWGNPTRWSGSGTYDVIIRLRNNAFLYKAVSVDFSSADTTVNFSDFTQIK
jgi:hypothetical protein